MINDAAAGRPTSHNRIILDTDLGGDIDNLGAVALMNALADAGHGTILGVISDTPQRHAVGAIAVVNRWYGRPGVPIGRPRELEVQDTYADVVAKECGPCLDGEDAPLTVPTYRKLLAGCPDGSVIIATIGVLAHLAELLDSTADDTSTLSGTELVRRKVGRVVTMGGIYPESSERVETNFKAWDNPSVTKQFVDGCPVPMYFVGSGLGHMNQGFGTGERLNELPERHPLRVGYGHFFRSPPWWVDQPGSERIAAWSIWDQITVWAAMSPGDEVGKHLREVRGVNHVAPDGHNRFEDDPNGPHVRYELKGDPATFARDVIEPLMLTRPDPATA